MRWYPWQVCCYELPDVVTALNEIQFIALHAAEEFQLGHDLLFWQEHTQALKAIIARDQYIPSLRYHPLANGQEKAGRKASRQRPDRAPRGTAPTPA